MKLVRQVAVRHAVGSSYERRYYARVAVKQFGVVLALVVASYLPAFFLRTAEEPHGAHERARVVVRQYAFEAFPQWAMEHPAEACPESLDDLAAYLDRDPYDPWGRMLEMRCGLGIRGAYIRSAGADGSFGTADDITSNDG